MLNAGQGNLEHVEAAKLFFGPESFFIALRTIARGHFFPHSFGGTVGLTQWRFLKKISRNGQGALSIIEEKQFRGDKRAGESLNQGGGFACFKDEFSF